MSNNVQQPSKGLRKALKSLWRKVFPKAIKNDGPRPTRRYNSERWPQDEEQGYFCDSLYTALLIWGDLHSESTFPRDSRHQSEAPVAQHGEDSPVIVGSREE